VDLALDDFGTGYSSLSYLSRFPVDILKMDRSFLQEGSSPEIQSLATAVVGLGATLALEVVAEGIERAEQWDTLRDLGCELGQGYLFARPMDADASVAFLAAPDAP
jgi:EAL domain-containing protein (putative c-di-GMP-specific phosphodiesterase class I)